MSRAQSGARRLLKALADGPATSGELANSFAMNIHYVSTALHYMHRSKYVTRTIFRRAGRGSTTTYMYRISGLGERILQKEAA